MNLYSEFTKYCRFWFKIFQNVMWKNSIFLTSEARLSPNLQNWTKLLRFYNSGLSGQLSFEWPDWKSLRLNYSNHEYIENIKACLTIARFQRLKKYFLKNGYWFNPENILMCALLSPLSPPQIKKRALKYILEARERYANSDEIRLGLVAQSVSYLGMNNAWL